ncbi:Uncharacterised protein [Pseudomonas aeruginosa]|nr:Uncharacterised protein [Pseudomonas aeruginosa]
MAARLRAALSETAPGLAALATDSRTHPAVAGRDRGLGADGPAFPAECQGTHAVGGNPLEPVRSAPGLEGPLRRGYPRDPRAGVLAPARGAGLGPGAGRRCPRRLRAHAGPGHPPEQQRRGPVDRPVPGQQSEAGLAGAYRQLAAQPRSAAPGQRPATGGEPPRLAGPEEPAGRGRRPAGSAGQPLLLGGQGAAGGTGRPWRRRRASVPGSPGAFPRREPGARTPALVLHRPWPSRQPGAPVGAVAWPGAAGQHAVAAVRQRQPAARA